MSELRKAARALVETRTERFESVHALESAQARFALAYERAAPAGATTFTPAWSQAGGRTVLEARFAPATRTQRLLQTLSIGMSLAVAGSIWAIASQEGATRFLFPLFTALSVLALPFVALGLASQRMAEEARILKAIRAALADEG